MKLKPEIKNWNLNKFYLFSILVFGCLPAMKGLAHNTVCREDLHTLTVSSIEPKVFSFFKTGTPLSARHFRNAKEGKDVFYALWSDGNLEAVDVADFKFALGLAQNNHVFFEARGHRFLKELGKIDFESESFDFKMKAHARFTPDERIENDFFSTALAKRKSVSQSSKNSRRPKTTPAKIFECKKILKSGWSGASFVENRVLLDNILLVTLFSATHPNEEDRRQDFFLASLVNTNFHALLTGHAARVLSLKNWSLGGQLLARFGIVSGSNRIQTLISSAILSDDPHLGSGNDRAQKIQNANDIYNVFSIFKGYMMDQWILKQSPAIAFNLCLRDAKLSSVLLGPGVAAALDRAGSWAIYLVWLGQFTGE